MTCRYTEGQTIVVQATFHDIDGVLVDPDTVTVTVEAPDGTLSHPTATGVSTGVFQTAVTMDQVGWWKVRTVGMVGEDAAVCETQCCAKPSILTPTSPASPGSPGELDGSP